ncbi:hypothetical protein V5O48_019614, partial [Marasmius crinis-equi]
MPATSPSGGGGLGGIVLGRGQVFVTFCIGGRSSSTSGMGEAALDPATLDTDGNRGEEDWGESLRTFEGGENGSRGYSDGSSESLSDASAILLPGVINPG